MIGRYLATPRRGRSVGSTPLAQLLAQFARAAEQLSSISNLTIRKSSVVFSATPDALDQLQAQFGGTFIIEPDRHLDH